MGDRNQKQGRVVGSSLTPAIPERSLAPARRLAERGIPVETLIPARARRRRRNTEPHQSIVLRDHRLRAFEHSPDIAALYAADVIEGTPELPMPDRNGPVHGLFSTTDTRAAEHTEPMTYRDLVQRVIDRYQTEGFGPTRRARAPASIATCWVSERYATGRVRFQAARSEAGDACRRKYSGLTRGSILEVSARVPAPHILGMRVVEVSPTTAVSRRLRFQRTSATGGAGCLRKQGARQIPRVRHAATARGAATRGRTSGRPEDAFAIVPSRRGPPALERALTSLQTLSLGLAERVIPQTRWLSVKGIASS